MKKSTFFWIGLYSAVLLIVVGAYIHFTAKKSIRYPGFGIEVPAGYTTHGIDVSRYQQCIDWEQVTKMRDQGHRISFAITKATEGLKLTDPCFRANWSGMKEYHLLRGAYLYFHPNKSGKAQAAYFMSTVTLEPGDLPPIIDIEETKRMSASAIRKSLKECADVLEAAYGNKPILYTNVDFYNKNLGNEFDEYPLWAAHYEQANGPRISRNWVLWQHNCKGRVDGICSEVDFNVVRGNLYDLKKLCIK
jgi:lysozyme